MHSDDPLQLAVREIYPQLDLKRNKRSRRMTLRINAKNRRASLTIPYHSRTASVLAFVTQHTGWLNTQLARLPLPIPFEDGIEIPFLGQNRVIRISCDKTLKTSFFHLNNKEIILLTRRENTHNLLKHYLVKAAKETITQLAFSKAARIDETIKDIQLRDTQSRWGSCSSDKRLNFSWRLAFAPWESLDYVVAHEVAHLRHMDHSPAFWRLCMTLSEDYKAGKNWIDANGHSLMRYGASPTKN